MFQSRVLLTRPQNLEFEKYVFGIYLTALKFVQDQLDRVATLEQDLEILQSGEPGSPNPPISFEYRMAVVYRSEKKKILRSQINLITKVIQVLRKAEEVLRPENAENSQDVSQAYTALLLEPTSIELELCQQVQENTDYTEAKKEKELKKLEEEFFYRRVINSTYFQQLKTLILSHNYDK